MALLAANQNYPWTFVSLNMSLKHLSHIFQEEQRLDGNVLWCKRDIWNACTHAWGLIDWHSWWPAWFFALYGVFDHIALALRGCTRAEPVVLSCTRCFGFQIPPTAYLRSYFWNRCFVDQLILLTRWETIMLWIMHLYLENEFREISKVSFACTVIWYDHATRSAMLMSHTWRSLLGPAYPYSGWGKTATLDAEHKILKLLKVLEHAPQTTCFPCFILTSFSILLEI